MLGTDDNGEPDAPSPGVLAISWPLLAALSICLANARCCSIMFSAKSNTASRTSSGLPAALAVGCDRPLNPFISSVLRSLHCCHRFLKFSCVRRVSSANCSWGLEMTSLLLVDRCGTTRTTALLAGPGGLRMPRVLWT